MTALSSAGTILAFDFGERRIGVAVGESALGLAHPLATIEGARVDEVFAAIARLVEEWKPVHLVVGLPTRTDGTAHAMTGRARRFARRLEGRFNRPVTLVDERYTSRSADAALRDAGTHGPARKSARDRVAAQIILQAFLDDG